MSITRADVIVDAEGVVKWFDPKKGFGFIIGPEGQDIFAHYTRIDGNGFRVLKDGSRVRYDAERGEKGWHASRVVRVEDAEDAALRPHARSPRR
jgi:CspA family cold shock protein